MLSLLMPLVWIDPFKKFMNLLPLVLFNPFAAKYKATKQKGSVWYQTGQCNHGIPRQQNDDIRPNPFKARQTSPALAKPSNKVHPLYKKLNLLACQLLGKNQIFRTLPKISFLHHGDLAPLNSIKLFRWLKIVL